MLRELPAYPRLADGLELIVGPGESLQLRGCNPPLRLTGKMPHRLLPLIDGNHSVEAITEALDEWQPPDVLGALGMLAERGLIADAATAAADSPDERAQAAFYGTASTGPANRGALALQALSGARLHLFGWGHIAKELERELRTCGARSLTVEDWHSPPTPEQLTQRLAAVPASDLVLLALPRPAPALLAAANSACLSRGLSWLPVVLNRGEAIVGPTVIPGRSACYDCFKQRLLTHAAFPEDDAAYDAHLDRTADGAPVPEWPPFTSAVAALAAMEVVRIVTQFTPSITPGQALFIDGLSGAQRISPVWKVPRCPACLKAQRRDWGGEPG
jgi:bacteriocin biosynthesis cyclodehydratase domain-containing protein